MATYDLQQQEQIEELKTWWEMHGTLIAALVVALAVGVVGWQGWQWWQRSQASQAGQIYAGLQQAMMQQDVKRVRLMAGELIDRYAGTLYASQAALLSGKALAESGDLKSAQAQFGWAADQARDPALRDIARLRQAIALADDAAYDAALKLLAEPPAPALMPRYLEVRGDILVAQGKAAEARRSYDEALKSLEDARRAAQMPVGPYREVLETKRDATGAQP